MMSTNARLTKRDLIRLINDNYDNDKEFVAVLTTIEEYGNDNKIQSITFNKVLDDRRMYENS